LTGQSLGEIQDCSELYGFGRGIAAALVEVMPDKQQLPPTPPIDPAVIWWGPNYQDAARDHGPRIDYLAPNPYARSKSGNGMAVASLLCGLVGLLLFGIILGPLAIIFGAIAIGAANKNGGGKGMAIAGLLLGCVDLLVLLVFLAMVMK
jgi:hypothetical protein